MKLTDKEMEIMVLLWNSDVPLTSSEIVKASDKRTWKENSIYIIMRTLLKKGAVVFGHNKPTGTNVARTYLPVVSANDYAMACICDMQAFGVRINKEALIEDIRRIEGD